ETPEIDIHELVLLHSLVEIGAISGKEAKLERRLDAKLLMQATPCGRDRAFARTRMSAAGVRPQPAGVIFFWVALLQQDPPAPVDQEDRKGAMQEPRAVHGLLAGCPDGAISFVDQDQSLVCHLPRALSLAAL